MRYSKYMLFFLAATLAACDDDGVSVNDPGPAALVRFINAVPDTGTVDLRFIDKVENLPTLQGVAFRAASGVFQRADVGARSAVVFLNSTNVTATATRLVESTLDLAADTRYTLIYAGRATGNQDQLAVINEAAPPTPPAGQIAIKVLHAAVGTGPVDVYVAPATSGANNTDPIANAVTVIRNVGYLAQSGYVNVPVRPTSGEILYQFAVTPAGATNVVLSGRPNLPGAAATVSTTGPQPGVQIAGSVLTAVVLPGSVPGTRQSTTANQTPTVALIVDKPLNP
jgi:hypothetical protein